MTPETFTTFVYWLYIICWILLAMMMCLAVVFVFVAIIYFTFERSENGRDDENE